MILWRNKIRRHSEETKSECAISYKTTLLVSSTIKDMRGKKKEDLFWIKENHRTGTKCQLQDNPDLISWIVNNNSIIGLVLAHQYKINMK